MIEVKPVMYTINYEERREADRVLDNFTAVVAEKCGSAYLAGYYQSALTHVLSMLPPDQFEFAIARFREPEDVCW